MTPLTFVLASGTLTFGIPLGLAVRELWLLPRVTARGGDEPPPKERFGNAPKPLPACLLPRPDPARVEQRIRVLEDA